MMTSKLRLFMLLSALALTGCANSGFSKATAANTTRADDYQMNIITQAANNMKVVNNCFLSSAGYAPVAGTENAVIKIGEPTGNIGCIVMATAFGTQNAMLTAFAPFIAKELMSRVPAAPEEIAFDVLKKGLEFSLLKYGIDAVGNVVNTGQLANAQIASQGIEAAAKPAQVIDKPVLVAVPAGSSVVPLEPIATAP